VGVPLWAVGGRLEERGIEAFPQVEVWDASVAGFAPCLLQLLTTVLEQPPRRRPAVALGQFD
jgi:hypothetical protein